MKLQVFTNRLRKRIGLKGLSPFHPHSHRTQGPTWVKEKDSQELFLHILRLYWGPLVEKEKYL